LSCTVDACDLNTGDITHTSTCDDGLACTTDSCGTGGCTYTANCNDSSICTQDACGAGGCTHTPMDSLCTSSGLGQCTNTGGSFTCTECDPSDNAGCDPGETCDPGTFTCLEPPAADGGT
jgi:hypothetical protein